jgi:hypothetical protein
MSDSAAAMLAKLFARARDVVDAHTPNGSRLEVT